MRTFKLTAKLERKSRFDIWGSWERFINPSTDDKQKAAQKAAESFVAQNFPNLNASQWSVKDYAMQGEKLIINVRIG